MNRVIVVGSPRVDGRSASLADELLYACIDECPDDGVSIVSVASTNVGPCTGCDACAQALDEAPALPEEGDPLYPHPAVAESDAALHQCPINDDMPEVRKHLDAADELIVVSPVYFACVPAQFKCLLDRLQPYYRSDLRQRVKRPLILHVVGEGGDPHGFDPLVGTVSSAFSVAGFELQAIFDWVGKIGPDGEILGDPQEYVLAGDDADEDEWAEEVADDETEALEDAFGDSSEGDDDERLSGRSAGSRKPGGRPDARLSLSQPTKGGRKPKGSAGSRGGASGSGGSDGRDDCGGRASASRGKGGAPGTSRGKGSASHAQRNGNERSKRGLDRGSGWSSDRGSGAQRGSAKGGSRRGKGAASGGKGRSGRGKGGRRG